MKTVSVGTKDVEGAKVVSISGSDVTLEKDGRTFYLELEYDYEFFSCICDGPCSCAENAKTAYLIATELVE